MLRGGINDQVGAGFHRCARDERWIVPHFEKLVPLNAQLAAVYARAGRARGDEELSRAADSLAGFCLQQARQGGDAIVSDTHYYTWTARELLEAVSPSLLQAVSLHYNSTPDGSRQVLYRARKLETLAGYSHEPPQTLQQRLDAGRRQLREARARRPAPAAVGVNAPSWPATTIHWLFRAAGYGCEAPVAELALHLERLAAGRFHGEYGYARASEAGEGWLEDQAAILAAMLAAFRSTGEAAWRERAQTLAEVVLSHFAGGAGWIDRAGRNAPAEPSQAIVDDAFPSPIATLTDALADLTTVTGDARYATSARRLAADHLPGAKLGAWTAALWRAWLRLA